VCLDGPYKYCAYARLIMEGISLQVVNPCSTQTEAIMTDFVQNSAQVMEDNFRQTFLKGSEKR
jgi:hypothetical protein